VCRVEHFSPALAQEKDDMENVSSVQNTILKAVVNSLKLFYAHLNARNLVVSDGW